MGVSTDAILVYGYELGTELPWEEEDVEDHEYVLLRLLGNFTEKWSENNEGYFQRKGQAEKEIGVQIILHCSYDYPMYILGANESATVAYRGSPQLITDFKVEPEWDEKLERAAKILGIDGKPQWWLASMWG